MEDTSDIDETVCVMMMTREHFIFRNYPMVRSSGDDSSFVISENYVEDVVPLGKSIIMLNGIEFVNLFGKLNTPEKLVYSFAVKEKFGDGIFADESELDLEESSYIKKRNKLLATEQEKV